MMQCSGRAAQPLRPAAAAQPLMRPVASGCGGASTSGRACMASSHSARPLQASPIQQHRSWRPCQRSGFAANAASPDAPEPAPEGTAASAQNPDLATGAEPLAGQQDTDLDPETPLSPEEILQMVQEQEDEREAAPGEGVLELLKEDPQAAYDYVQRAYEEGPRPVRNAQTVLVEEATGKPVLSLPPAMANDLVGMGTWVLRGMVDPVLAFLIMRIEGCWREVFEDDFTLYPADHWKAQGWHLCDSEDPQRELDGFSYADVPSPEPGTEGYPRLLIENRVYCSRVFRKLHIEVAVRQDGLQVLHVVLYPRYRYDVPILALDVVMVNGRCTLAVADACPVRARQQLPHHYLEAMALLQETYLPDAPAARRIPEWGTRIFSPLAICTTPRDAEELAALAKYIVALHRTHLDFCQLVEAVPDNTARGRSRLKELLEGHQSFVENQLSNQKTRRVLDKAFGEEWTQAYMEQLMFDFDPEYDPPYEDSSITRLYDYYSENPDFGALADEGAMRELDQDYSRSMETLQAAVETRGAGVSDEKLEMAMQMMYNHDPQFQAAVDMLVPQLGAQGDQGVGRVMSRELLQMLMGGVPAMPQEAAVEQAAAAPAAAAPQPGGQAAQAQAKV